MKRRRSTAGRGKARKKERKEDATRSERERHFFPFFFATKKKRDGL